MALVENIQRQDLDPIEIAISYQRLIEEIQVTQEELSDRVGKNRSTIANYLRLLKLDPIIQTGMRDGFISMGHGRALINIEDSNDQLDIYEKVLKDSLSVRETEAIVRNLKQPDVKNPPTKKDIPSFAKDAKKELSSLFDSKVDVKISDSGKGQFVFPFKNREEFQRILKLIKGEK
jgi:ParB family chromosome partitioning protein